MQVFTRKKCDILLIRMLRNMSSDKMCICVVLVRGSVLANIDLRAGGKNVKGFADGVSDGFWGGMVVGWGVKNVGGREQLWPFLPIPGDFRM